jgi:hypothetical protein
VDPEAAKVVFGAGAWLGSKSVTYSTSRPHVARQYMCCALICCAVQWPTGTSAASLQLCSLSTAVSYGWYSRLQQTTLCC